MSKASEKRTQVKLDKTNQKNNSRSNKKEKRVTFVHHKASQSEKSSKTIDIGFAVGSKATKSLKQGEHYSFVFSSGVTLEYPIVDLLLSCARDGCTVNCGDDWTKDYIAAAAKRDLRVRKSNKEAADYTWKEALQKEQNKHCNICK